MILQLEYISLIPQLEYISLILQLEYIMPINSSRSWVVLAALVHQMLFPPSRTSTNVQVAQRTSVGSSHRLSRQALFLLHVCLVVFLVHCFLAPRTFLVVLAVSTLPHQVRSKRTYLHSLPALVADGEHGAGVEEVQILVILFCESFVDPLAEVTSVLTVLRVGCLLRYGYELVAALEVFLHLGLPSCFVAAFVGTDGLLVESLRLILSILV